jgi:hypothetical protein
MSLRSKIKLSVAALLLTFGAYMLLHASTTTQFSYSTESFLNQSGNMATTTLFTPTVDGNYQVEINVEFVGPCCGVGDPTSVSPTLTWSDNTKAYAASPNTFAANSAATNYNSPQMNMHVKAGSPVQISTNVPCSSGCASYNIFVTVIGN